MNILVIGSGGREHAIVWKLASSKRCNKLFVAPGNAGTALAGENIEIAASDFEAIGRFVTENRVDMVVVGPEDPLVNGIADFFASKPLLKSTMFIGPGRQGAMLEGSKDFAKCFMQRYGIPTAAYSSFTKNELRAARDFLATLQPPYVIKADGLAAGKGVAICACMEEAVAELEEMLVHEKFGQSSRKVVIEEFLKGIEVSVFAITDGESYCLLPSAKDYKRIGENDTGPNTGGMGAVSPVPFASPEFMKKVEERIVGPTVAGLKKDGVSYKGFLFFGLMKVEEDPYVIEYNVRLGDPEAEAIIPRVKSDLVDILEATAMGNLNNIDIEIESEFAATIVLASGGYPGSFQKGFEVNGLDQVEDSLLFFSGLSGSGLKPVTSGGRVMAITSLGKTLNQAIEKSYKSASLVDFSGKYYRNDIGNDLK